MPRSVANALLNQQFRQALTPGAGHLMPGAANALAARVIEATGHKMLMVSGAAVANTFLGAPDIGLVSLAELAAHVGAIRDAVNIPLLVDGDTGFGNAINVVHTVRVLERAGANAIMLEDQTFPKRCGHFENKTVISKSEMVQKIKAAVDTREDDQMMILARTDARSMEGLEAAMDRARAALRDAGYNGEPIIHINPSDFPAVTQQGRLTVELMRKLGVNMQPIESDWATILARRANRNPPAQGGWHLHNTNGPAATIANPAVSFAIRMNGQAAWPGWPSDADAEAQVEAWINADDQAGQDAAMRRLQEITWESLPFAPTGLFRLRTAFRRDLSGVLQGPNPFLWNLRRA